MTTKTMFAQVHRGTVIQCYRTNALSPYEIYPTQKKTKKSQKDVLRKSAGISPELPDTTSGYTGPIEPYENTNVRSKKFGNNTMKKVIFDLCECHNYETDNNHGPETWNSITDYYDNAETTDEYSTVTSKKFRTNTKKKATFNFCDCQNYIRDRNLEPKTWNSITDYYGKAETTEVWADPENLKSKYYPAQYQMTHLVENTNDQPGDYKTDKSKHRRRSKTHKKRGRRLRSQVMSNDSEKQNYDGIIGPVDTRTIRLYRPQDVPNQMVQEPANKSEFKTRSKSKEVTEDLSFKHKCPDGICAEEARKNKSYVCKCDIKAEPHLIKKDLSRSFLNINNVVKMKDKFLCLCHKYSQKVINMKPDNKDLGNKDQILQKSRLSQQAKNINYDVIKKEHESEQTGEPFFEIQVSPRDMCVLNPIEIKKNIIKYGKTGKNEPKCICPSRGTLRAGEVCKTGICKKAYKNKQMNFNCWCKKPLSECGDATCDAINIADTRNTQNNKHIKTHERLTTNLNKPLLEVQLDIDKMCVVNPEEIEDKIINNMSVDEICSSGVCREAALNRKSQFFCKCIRKKISSEITECTEDTCTDETKKKKSKFSLLCSRIISKSENWSQRNRNTNQKRIKRRSFYELSANKLRTGKIFSRFDNLRQDTVEIKQINEPKINKPQKKSDKPNIKHEKVPKVNKPQKKVSDKHKIKPKKVPKVKITQKKIISKKLNVKQEKVQKVKKIEKKQSDKLNIKHEKVSKSSMTRKHNNPYSHKNVFNDYNVSIPLPKPRELNKYNSTYVKDTGVSNEFRYKTKDVICTCAHNCECDKNEMKLKVKKKKESLKRKKRNKKKDEHDEVKDMKKRAKLDKKGEKRSTKERLKEIKAMQKKMQEEPMDTNFCTAFIIGILKIGFKTLLFIIVLVFSLLRHPKRAYLYVMDRIKDPGGTFNKLKKWFRDAILIKKLQIAQTIRGSDTLTILADHILDTPLYQTFADKGKTKQDQSMFEQRSKARKRRIRKREQQAIHSCRHMLLTTLRQTPCLWVYHICPNFYPQCLSLLAFMRSFSRILLFLVAFACWTPCILSFELCRACLCCFMCTG